MNEINWTECPCCKKWLHSTWKPNDSSVQEAGGNIDHDENGPFMRCQHCSSRIALKNIGLKDGVAQYMVSGEQPCNQEVPQSQE
jgi:DNA-directed RNA polymerase subunit RPC12/RpoP